MKKTANLTLKLHMILLVIERRWGLAAGCDDSVRPKWTLEGLTWSVKGG